MILLSDFVILKIAGPRKASLIKLKLNQTLINLTAHHLKCCSVNHIDDCMSVKTKQNKNSIKTSCNAMPSLSNNCTFSRDFSRLLHRSS